jgi:integrase
MKQAHRLTAKMIEGVQPDPGKRLMVWDSIVPNLALRVTPQGSKSFVVLYTSPTGRQRWFTVGGFPKITIEQARAAAKGINGAVAKGNDPSGQKIKLRSAMTLDEFWEVYMADYAIPVKKASTVRNDRYNYASHIGPRLGRRLLSEITRGEVDQFHKSLYKTPHQANRVLALLSGVFRVALDWDERDAMLGNPAKGIKKFPESARKRYLSADELIRLGRTLADLVSENAIPPEAAEAIRLIALTGCRRGEILGLKWGEVNLSSGTLHLEDSKSGPKDVYLSRPAIELLAGLKRHESGYVIPSQREGKHRVCIKKPWSAVCERAGLADLHIHDLRHSFASFGVGLGATLPVLGELLGHKQSRTTQRYAHVANDPLRAAAESIGSHVADLLNGGGAEVVEVGTQPADGRGKRAQS